MSRLSLQMPATTAQTNSKAISQSIRPFANEMSKWAQPAPTAFNDINCFAVMIHAPEQEIQANSCSNLTGSELATPHFIAGGFLPNTEQVITVPTGRDRTIYLVGFHATSNSECINTAGNTSAARFSSAQFSPPVILSRVTLDLTGGDIPVDMPVSSTLSGSDVFEDCAPSLFSKDVAPLEPTAIISSVAAVNNLSVVPFTISGTYTYEYTYALVPAANDCTGAVYVPFVSGSTAINASVGVDGDYTLCVKAKSASGKEQTLPSKATWLRDTSAPGAAPTFSIASVGNDVTPDISVLTVPASTEEIIFYTDFGCPAISEVYRSNITAPGTVTLSTQTPGNKTYYALVEDAAGNQSSCTSTSQNYLLDIAAPSAPANLSARYGISVEYTPYFTWEVAPDAAVSSGIAEYEVALGTGPAALQNIRSFTSIGNSLSVYSALTALEFFVNGSTYYFSVRAKDAAGNYGSVSTQSFTVQTLSQLQQKAFIKGPINEAGDEWGSAVAIDADTMVVGAASADNTKTDAGSGAVHRRIPGTNTWARVDYLVAPDRADYDYFGAAVAVSGDTVVIGAPGENSPTTFVVNGPAGNISTGSTGNGAAYVYRKNPTDGRWYQEAYLKPSTAFAGGKFGSSVAIEGDTIVVGAPDSQTSGRAYVFKRTGTTWAHGGELSQAAPTGADRFGAAVSISGANMAIGAANFNTSGSVYIFRRDGAGNWQEDHMVWPAAGGRTTGDAFGTSVQIHGEMLVVGAPGEDSNETTPAATVSTVDGAADSGAAYVYRFGASVYALERFLKPINNRAGNYFGKAVGIFGTSIVVGAPGEDDCNSLPAYSFGGIGYTFGCSNSGGVYLFQGGVSGNWNWTNFFKPTYNQAGTAELFGGAVAISGSAIAVGAIGESSDQLGVVNGTSADSSIPAGYTQSGAAYLFDVYDPVPQSPVIAAPL